MRVPRLIKDFMEWRWAPCMGLIAASLAFVALAMLLIPSQFDGAAGAGRSASGFDRPNLPSTTFGASIAQQSAPIAQRGTEDVSPPAIRMPHTQPTAAPQNGDPVGVPQRGFSPLVDRGDRPLPPMPEAPPPAAPAATPPPAPGAVDPDTLHREN
jgi:hypothetical protein